MTTTTTRVCALLALCVVWPSFTSTAEATSISLGAVYHYGLSAEGFGFSGHDNLQSFNGPQLDVPVVDQTVEPRFPDGAFATARLSGSAAFGTLRAQANTIANVKGAVRGATAGATTQLEVNFTDALTFASHTLSAGTQITFEIDYVLDSSFAMFPGTSPLCSGGSPIPGGGYITLDNGAGLALSRTLCGPSTPDHWTATQSFTSRVGDTVGIFERLQLGSIADACDTSLCDPFQNQSVDAADTAMLFVRVVTPGVTFRSESGAVYAPADTIPGDPVPEPGSLALLGTGLAMAVRQQRRRH